jgi:hypothetical protein
MSRLLVSDLSLVRNALPITWPHGGLTQAWPFGTHPKDPELGDYKELHLFASRSLPELTGNAT